MCNFAHFQSWWKQNSSEIPAHGIYRSVNSFSLTNQIARNKHNDELNFLWIMSFFMFLPTAVEMHVFNLNLCEPSHDKTNKITSAPSKDLDQPGHPTSLIRVLAVCSIGSQGPKVSTCGQQTLITLGGCSGRSESSLGAQVILLVLSCDCSC